MADAHVLDACALIALFKKEEGWEIVHGIMGRANKEEAVVFLHNATASEVYYDALYSSPMDKADEVLQSIFDLTIKFIDAVDREMIKRIGFYKTRYKVSFADCFVLATAEIYDAIIVTSDRHEFEPIEKEGRLRFEWIR